MGRGAEYEVDYLTNRCKMGADEGAMRGLCDGCNDLGWGVAAGGGAGWGRAQVACNAMRPSRAGCAAPLNAPQKYERLAKQAAEAASGAANERQQPAAPAGKAAAAAGADAGAARGPALANKENVAGGRA